MQCLLKSKPLSVCTKYSEVPLGFSVLFAESVATLNSPGQRCLKKVATAEIPLDHRSTGKENVSNSCWIAKPQREKKKKMKISIRSLWPLFFLLLFFFVSGIYNEMLTRISKLLLSIQSNMTIMIIMIIWLLFIMPSYKKHIKKTIKAQIYSNK